MATYMSHSALTLEINKNSLKSQFISFHRTEQTSQFAPMFLNENDVKLNQVNGISSPYCSFASFSLAAIIALSSQ